MYFGGRDPASRPDPHVINVLYIPQRASKSRSAYMVALPVRIHPLVPCGRSQLEAAGATRVSRGLGHRINMLRSAPSRDAALHDNHHDMQVSAADAWLK